MQVAGARQPSGSNAELVWRRKDLCTLPCAPNALRSPPFARIAKSHAMRTEIDYEILIQIAKIM